jgi:hypothetical protein
MDMENKEPNRRQRALREIGKVSVNLGIITLTITGGEK